MAHQTHSLPWRILTDQFRYACEASEFNGITNLVPCQQPGQAASIDHFSRTFASIISNFIASSTVSLEKDISTEDVPAEETLVSRCDARAIKKSINYLKTEQIMNFTHYDHHCLVYRHQEDEVHEWLSSPSSSTDSNQSRCCDLLSLLHKINNWQYVIRSIGCHNAVPAHAVNYVKMWLSYGQMKPLYRLCHYGVRIDELYDWCTGYGLGQGWREVLISALYPYMALNMLYFKMTLTETEMEDYRDTALYQRALILAICKSSFDVHKLPHRLFFGIPSAALGWDIYLDYKTLLTRCGWESVSSLLGEKASSWYAATSEDILVISNILSQNGLPGELIRIILQLADLQYPETRLKIPDDPLHPDNAEELQKYLLYCWDLLVQCGVLAGWCGKEINWEEEVKTCIFKMCFSGINRSIHASHGYELRDWWPMGELRDGVLRYQRHALMEAFLK